MKTLMQLLNVGQSLVDLRGEPHRYEIAKQGWLPKFEPSPDFHTSRSSARCASSVSSAKPLHQGLTHRAQEEDHKVQKRTSQSTGKLTILQQGELNLNNIKVVCNDLSESDIELKVHGSTRVSTKNEQVNWSKARYKAGLNWLAGRFFRTSKTQI